MEKTKDEFSPELKEVLSKMMSYCGKSYEDIDFHSEYEPYYYQYKWYPSQERDFRIWFIKYLKNNKVRIRAFTDKWAPSYTSNKWLEHSIIDPFVFNHGLMTYTEKEEKEMIKKKELKEKIEEVIK